MEAQLLASEAILHRVHNCWIFTYHRGLHLQSAASGTISGCIGWDLQSPCALISYAIVRSMDTPSSFRAYLVSSTFGGRTGSLLISLADIASMAGSFL